MFGIKRKEKEHTPTDFEREHDVFEVIVSNGSSDILTSNSSNTSNVSSEIVPSWDNLGIVERVDPKTLEVSEECIQLVAHFEAFQPTAYYCPGGVLTIGYGHTNAEPYPKFDRNTIWDEEYAMFVLKNDLNNDAKYVKKYIKVPLFQHEFDALVSFTLNLGPGSLRTSTLRKVLNRGDYAGVYAQLQRWNKSGDRVLPGLTRRRKSEGHLFNTGKLNYFEEW